MTVKMNKMLNNGMRKIKIIISSLILLQMMSCNCTDCNYIIDDYSGNRFCTKSYTIDDNGCIEFKCIKYETKIQICGKYTIINSNGKNQ